MKSVCYSVAMSLDGYIAGPNGEADWILMDPEIDFAALFSRFDTALMGRRSYEAALAMGQAEAMPGIRTVVVSRTLRPEDHPGVTILADDLDAAVNRLRAEPGKDIWLFGGGVLFRSLLELGEVDEIQVAVIPVLLGGGLPLLPPGTPTTAARLRLARSRRYAATGIMLLDYTVERTPSAGVP